MQHYDALLVLHQDAPADIVREHYLKSRWQRVYILTTHHLFSNERTFWIELLGGCRISFGEFARLLHDEEMEACDDAASSELLENFSSEKIKNKYARMFMARSIYHKNALIFRSLCRVSQFDQVYYCSGLGVSDEFWKSQHATSLCDKTQVEILPMRGRRIAKGIINAWRQWCTNAITVLCSDGKYFVFFDSTRRLMIRPKVPRKHYINFGRWIFLLFAKLGAWQPLVIGTSIHTFRHWYSRLSYPVEIFIDGYHPSNYPRSYIDQYTTGTFVVRDMFDASWFEKFGKPWKRPYGFTKSMKMAESAPPPNEIQTIYLILNHAGDWSALINRSDTDVLVEVFCLLASRIPRIEFIIRLHPTMDRPEHEGSRASLRLRNYVRYCNLSNLSISNKTLEQDLSIGQLFLSEYSNVILDIFRRGKLGLIVNITGRRSFMQDYEKLGFPAASDQVALSRILLDIVDNPSAAQSRQNQAASLYNAKLAAFLSNA